MQTVRAAQCNKRTVENNWAQERKSNVTFAILQFDSSFFAFNFCMYVIIEYCRSHAYRAYL